MLQYQNASTDIRGHLSTFMSGSADSNITTEAELLLARSIGCFNSNWCNYH